MIVGSSKTVAKPPHKGQRWRYKLPATGVAALLITTILAFSPSVAPASAMSENPDIDPSCDAKVALVLDASGSVAGFDAVDQVRQMGIDLVDSLAGRGVEMGIVEFASYGDLAVPYTPVTRQSAREVFNPYFSGDGSPGYYDGRIGKYTNWQDGFEQVRAGLPDADLVLYVTDGVPNTIGTPETAVDGNGGGEVAAAAAAAVSADLLKEAGSHVLALGVAGIEGEGIELLKSISGSDDLRTAGVLEGDYFVGGFDELDGTFNDIIREICGGTTVIRSVLDADGDLSTTDDRTVLSDLPINVVGTNLIEQNLPETAANGAVTLHGDWDGRDKIGFNVVQRPPAGHYVEEVRCSGVTDAGFHDFGYTLRDLVVGRRDLGVCTFFNVELPAILELDLNIDSIDDVDGSQDNSAGDVINYRAVATNAGGAILTNVQIDGGPLSWDRCAPDAPARLTKGRTLTCWGTHVIGADEPAGGIVHTATATSVEAPPVSDSELTRLPAAGLSFDKDITRSEDRDESRDHSVGDVLHYRLVAKNIGDANLTRVVISDPTLPNLTCSPTGATTLRPGQRLVCTGTLTVTPANLGTLLTNTATVDSDQLDPVSDGEAVGVPALGARLSTIITGYDDLDDNGSPSRGDLVHVLDVATNVEASNLTGVVISDSLSGDTLECATTVSWMVPGETVHCNGTYSIVRADHGTTLASTAALDTRQIDLTAGPANLPVPAAELTVVGVLDRLVDADESRDPSAGDTAVFTFSATNTGEMTLTDVEFTVDGQNNVTCRPEAVDRLAVGEFIECTGIRPIGPNDRGTIIAPSAIATSWQAPDASDIVELPVGAPAATVDKTVVEMLDRVADQRVSDGDELAYRIEVTNTGSSNLVVAGIEDPQLENMFCRYPIDFDQVLHADEQIVCRGTQPIEVDDAGTTLTNTVVFSSPQLDDDVSDTADYEIPVHAVCAPGATLFGLEHLYARQASASRDLELAPGRYRVALASYDGGHRAGHQLGQTNEVWALEFLDADGNVVAVSSSTDDLADDDRIHRYLVDEALVVDGQVAAVRARNAATEGVNSVAAVCAEVTAVEVADTTPVVVVDPSETDVEDTESEETESEETESEETESEETESEETESETADPQPVTPMASSLTELIEAGTCNVDFGNKMLMGRDGFRSHEVAYDLAAGTYQLTAVSEDLGHRAGHATYQTMEQFRIDFVAADGRVVASSGYTADLADADLQAINGLGEIAVPEAVVTLRIVHRPDADVDSIHAVCGGITAV